VVCLEPFHHATVPRQPRQLTACGHSLCTACLRSLLARGAAGRKYACARPCMLRPVPVSRSVPGSGAGSHAVLIPPALRVCAFLHV
jgi:hypothetical protein